MSEERSRVLSFQGNGGNVYYLREGIHWGNKALGRWRDPCESDRRWLVALWECKVGTVEGGRWSRDRGATETGIRRERWGL
jgi:hypothetical protein